MPGGSGRLLCNNIIPFFLSFFIAIFIILKLTSFTVLNCVDAGLFTGTPTSTGPTSTAGASGTSSHCRRADPSTHKVTMLIVVS